ncbi:MAG: RNA polymerase sigma factor RpoD/SigA [Myxococcota bacterium]
MPKKVQNKAKEPAAPAATPETLEVVDEVVPEVETGTAVDADEEVSEPLDPEAEVEAELAAGDIDLDLDLDIDAEVEAVTKAAKKPLPSIAGSRTPEALSALNIYLTRLKHVVILPIEEQAELAAEFQRSGDKESAARLVASNLRLVVKIAFQFRRQWADVMDLIAEGNLGLAEAIRKFDATRGIPFPSYARFWIRARILAFIQENKHLIHAGSRAARKLFWRLERERRQLISEGLDPEPKRLAERVGVSEADIRELAPILDQRPVSLDVPVHGDEDGRTRGEVMADQNATSPEDNVGGDELQSHLKAVFAEYRETLDERERAIWDLRLATDTPVRLEDLGDQFGVSKERVRQLEVRIKKRLGDFVKRRLGSDVIVEALQH